MTRTRNISSVGNQRDRMTKYMFITIFSSASGSIFRISLFIPNGICSNKAQSTRKIKLFLVV